MSGSGFDRPPACLADALALIETGLDFVNTEDLPGLPIAVQADALRAWSRLDAKRTAAEAALVGAFDAVEGYAVDGQSTTSSWLASFTRCTVTAARQMVAGARRLREHLHVARALAAGRFSASIGKLIIDFCGKLPADDREPAERVLTDAAEAGANAADLSMLATEIHRRVYPNGLEHDEERVAADRGLTIAKTFGGVGKLNGDLTAHATNLAEQVIGALATRKGPEDTRTPRQRRHDALVHALSLLVGCNLMPERGGAKPQVKVDIPLAALRRLPGAADSVNEWVRLKARQLAVDPAGSSDRPAAHGTDLDQAAPTDAPRTAPADVVPADVALTDVALTDVALTDVAPTDLAAASPPLSESDGGSSPDVSHPAVRGSEPTTPEPKMSEPKMSEPKMSEPKMFECKASEPSAPEFTKRGLPGHRGDESNGDPDLTEAPVIGSEPGGFRLADSGSTSSDLSHQRLARGEGPGAAHSNAHVEIRSEMTSAAALGDGTGEYGYGRPAGAGDGSHGAEVAAVAARPREAQPDESDSCRPPSKPGRSRAPMPEPDILTMRGLPPAAVGPPATLGGTEPISERMAAALACDSVVIPTVTGAVDQRALSGMTEAWLRAHRPAGAGDPVGAGCGCREPLAPATRQRLRETLLRWAVEVLSGPGGLASYLRTGHYEGSLATPSIVLDVGRPTKTVPAHLEQAVRRRDRHCRWPGCDRPAELSQVHHIVPRAAGGLTRLNNLLTLCEFHHLITVHTWGWTIRLGGDGTTTAVSPGGRTLRESEPTGTGPPGPSDQAA